MKNWFFLSPAISKRNPVRKIKIYLIKLCKFNFKLTYKPPKPLKSPRKMIQTIDKKILYISNSKCQSLPKCITTHLSVNKHPPKVNSFRKKSLFNLKNSVVIPSLPVCHCPITPMSVWTRPKLTHKKPLRMAYYARLTDINCCIFLITDPNFDVL